MQIAVVSPAPEDVVVDKTGWIVEPLRACGHDVRRVTDLTGIAIADRECDVLLFDHKHAGVNWNSLAQMGKRRSRRSIWIQWYRDLIATSRTASLEQQENMLIFGKVMRGMDLVLVKERSLLDEYRALGISARWFDQACPADMPQCEHRDNPEWDVLVLGSVDYPQRYADAQALARAGFRVLWASPPGSMTLPEGCKGNRWVHPTTELPELASRSAVVLGVDWRCDLPGYTSDRSYLVAGMGACYIARVSDYDDGSVGGSPAAQLAAWVYDDQASMLEVVRQALSQPEERKRRGEAARKLVMSRHTYHNRAAELCGIIGELQGERLALAAGSVS